MNEKEPPAKTLTLSSSGETARTIGPYHLLEKIGEGGMGEVWVAEQHKPIRRRVALKLIKAGMDTKQVIARFESERQALAMMDHPAIAKVYDAGETPEGRPYFVMEYVQGTPITAYCDQNRLTTQERLELFKHICEGVQHAHQKAVIHRDLKPTNILVAIQGGKAVPKIIDFGVAKATAQSLTERTMYTELGVMIGTPEYMSPEQAEMTGQNVDTRTDVYSLGAILYELLVGALPFDPKELRRAGFDEIRRKIRDEDPPKPSTKLSTMGDASTTQAANRRTERPTLIRQIRGDLDWITMKALEKDRTRRYGSPSELAADIDRYLHHQPIVARPPSTAYRATKFVRRHRVGVGVAATISVLLITFSVTTALQARRIARERDRANQEAEAARQVSDFLTGLFKVSDPSEARGNSVTAREILDKGAEKIARDLKDAPGTRAKLMDTMGWTYVGLGLYNQAMPLLEEALRLRRQVLGNRHLDVAQSLYHLGWVKVSTGDYATAEAHLREALAEQRSLLGDNHPDVAKTLSMLAELLRYKGDYTAAEPFARQALAMMRKLPNVTPIQLSYSIAVLAGLLDEVGRFGEAETLEREALETLKTAPGRDDERVSTALSSLGVTLWHKGDYAGAEALFREALEIEKKVLGPRHPLVGNALGNLSAVVYRQGRLGEARALYQECVAIKRASLGPDSPELGSDLVDLGNLLLQEGNLTAAETAVREGLGIERKVLGNEHRETARGIIILGEVLGKKGDRAAEESLRREGLAILRRVLGEDHWEVGYSLVELADLLVDTGRAAEAEGIARQGVRILRKALPPENTDCAAGETILGRCLGKLGQFAEAEQLLLQGYEVLKAKDPQSRMTKLRLQWLIALYEAWGNPGKANEWRAKLEADKK